MGERHGHHAEPCAVQGCPRRAPGRFNTFCAVHHFMIPLEDTRAILRMKIACANTTSEDERQHLTEQLPSYIRLAVGKLSLQLRGAV